MAGAERMTIEEVVRKVLREEHADVRGGRSGALGARPMRAHSSPPQKRSFAREAEARRRACRVQETRLSRSPACVTRLREPFYESGRLLLRCGGDGVRERVAGQLVGVTGPGGRSAAVRAGWCRCLVGCRPPAFR